MKSLAKHIITLCIVLASCSSEDEVPVADKMREISISASSTRAVGDTYPLDPAYKMWVTALYHNKQHNAHSYYLSDAQFESRTDGGTTVWAAPDGAYYPLDGTMDFVACASHNGEHKPATNYVASPSITSTSKNVCISALELDFRSANLDGTDDLLISSVSPEAPCGLAAHNTVPLEFYHLMTNIRFVFTAATEEAGQFMKMSRIELGPKYVSGVAQLSRTKDSSWTIAWPTTKLSARKGLKRNIEIYPVHNSTEYTPVDFFIPPQTVSASSVFWIFCRYSTPETETKDMMYLKNPFVSSETMFEAGKRYTYNVHCRMLPQIEFNISLVDDANGIVLDQWTVEPTIEL